MAKQKKKIEPQPLGKCRDCAHHYDDHELTAYEPRHFFLTRCPFPNKYGKLVSKFLNHVCDNVHFTPQK